MSSGAMEDLTAQINSQDQHDEPDVAPVRDVCGKEVTDGQR